MIQTDATIELHQLSTTSSLEETHVLAGELLGHDIFVFVSSPRSWGAHWWLPGLIAGGHTGAFEVQWFNDAGLLRWVRQGATGRVSILTTKPFDTWPNHVQGVASSNKLQSKTYKVIERRYRCWGTVTSVDGAARIAEIADSRIGKISLPFTGDVGPGDMLCIRTRELLSSVADGNRRVIDELPISITAEANRPADQERHA
jgi:hypothetical protein